MPKLSIIIPCYFNESNIPVTTKRLIENEKLFPAEVEFEYVMVDDGSKDKTLEKLLEFKESYPQKVKIVKLAGNVGSYNAIVAGMEYASGDCCSMIAADLQDPPELMVKMYDYWQKGIKLVVANRTDRNEPLSQRMFSNIYHSLLKKLALPNIPDGGFDFVFFDKQLKEELLKMKEGNTNSLYLLAWMNFDMVAIPYVRNKREIGISRWTFKKKLKLFVDSFISFTYFPIRLISVSGILLGCSAFIYIIYVLIAKYTGNINVSGWSSLMVVFLFVSSFQMIAIGILGEYIWRTLEATRKRPIYIVDKVY